jgi:NAD(P)-dependent dehydrogenase (short-subunit alcohol dehydrogenase family)
MSIITLESQRVVILGGSSGMGYAVAEAALAEGAHVIIGSSSKDRVDAAVARLGGDAQGFVVDVTDESALSAFFSQVGSFDHMVFTAGDDGSGYQAGPVEELNLSTADRALKVRFWGALAAIKHAKPNLSTTGSVILTDGVLSFMPMKGCFWRALSVALSNI